MTYYRQLQYDVGCSIANDYLFLLTNFEYTLFLEKLYSLRIRKCLFFVSNEISIVYLEETKQTCRTQTTYSIFEINFFEKTFFIILP